MKIKTFRPLLPSSNDAAKALVCPPYDVVSLSEARAILADNPSSFISVVRPDATLPDSASPVESYQASGAALKRLQASSSLVRASEARLYVYEQTLNGKSQRGLVSLAAVSDYDDGTIKRHERTRAQKEEDRTRLTDHLSANVGPVFLTYPDVAKIDKIVNHAVTEQPLFDLPPGNDETIHTVWPLSEAHSQELVSLFETDVPVSYIADGHHRAASAARVGRERKERAGEMWTGEEDFNYFLTVLFPASHLTILAYNRIVWPSSTFDPVSFVGKLSDLGKLTKMTTPPSEVPEKSGTVFIFVEDDWHSFKLPKPEENCIAADTLDSSVIQKYVLAPLLGIDDPRKNDRIEFVGGIRGVSFLEEKARKTGGAVAFALHPVTVQQLFHVSDRGEVMPPKSTWFEPKLRSGFFVHTF